MIPAKVSTAQTIMIGPVLDADGAAKTDCVVADFKISTNGGAPAALHGSATLTHRHTGQYSLALTTSDLGTVGQAVVGIDATTNSCQPVRITVFTGPVYDALYGSSADGKLPATLAAGDVSGNLPANALAMADGLITAAKIAADAIQAAKIQAGALDGKGNWNIGKTGYDLVDTPNATARQAFATTLEAAILNEGDATALLAAIAAKVEEFLVNDGDSDATLAAISAAVWANATRTLTSGANIALAKGTGVTGFNDHSASDVWSHGTRVLTASTNLNDLSLADVRDAIGLAAANLDTQLGDILAASGGGGGLALSDAVPDPGTAGTVGAALRLILSFVDAAISSRLASGSYTAPDNAGIGAAAAAASSAATAAGNAETAAGAAASAASSAASAASSASSAASTAAAAATTAATHAQAAKDLAEASEAVDTSVVPWKRVKLKKGTGDLGDGDVLLEQTLKQANGNDLSSTEHVVGRAIG